MQEMSNSVEKVKNKADLRDKYDAVALFSGGLDSILAMRVVMDQGDRKSVV